MTVFADSSAVVKLYADEPGSSELLDVDELTISVLARVEVPSALWRKQRTGELDVTSAASLALAFEHDVRGSETGNAARFAVATLGDDTLDSAARLCATDGLRAYDAVQLATLIAVAGAVDVDAFACFDDHLRASAARRGFALLPFMS